MLVAFEIRWDVSQSSREIGEMVLETVRLVGLGGDIGIPSPFVAPLPLTYNGTE